MNLFLHQKEVCSIAELQVQHHLPTVNQIARDFADRLERVRYINDEVNDLKTEVDQ